MRSLCEKGHQLEKSTPPLLVVVLTYMGHFLQGGKNGRLMSFLDALASLKTMLDIQ